MVKPGYKQTEVGVIPEDWDCCRISETTARNPNSIKIGPFGSQLHRKYLTKTGYKVYGQANVYERDMTIGERYISKDYFDELRSCEIKSGDFLISMMGTIGKCMIVPEYVPNGIIDSHLIRIRFNPSKIFPEFILQLFGSRIVSDQAQLLSVGGIMDGLSSNIIKNIFLPVPKEINEQRAIAEALSDVDALIAALDKLIAKKRAVKTAAMQQLLTGRIRLPGF
ncbi:MAG: restriction endonuclease subunit S, partial [Leptolinea sp.]